MLLVDHFSQKLVEEKPRDKMGKKMAEEILRVELSGVFFHFPGRKKDDRTPQVYVGRGQSKCNIRTIPLVHSGMRSLH